MNVIPDPPAPTASDLARNRAQLLQEIAMRPDARHRRHRSKLMANIGPEPTSRPAAAAQGSPPPAGLRPPAKRRIGARFALTSVATIAILGALVAGDILGPAGWRGAATAQAAQVLNDAAQTTIQTADPVVEPGQYLKIQSAGISSSTWMPESGPPFQWLAREESVMYVPANRGDEWVWERSARIPSTFFDDRSKEFAFSPEAAEITGKAELLRSKNGAFYGSPDESTFPSPGYLNSIPRDPHKLLNSIYKTTIGKGQSIDGEALVFIADLLRTGMVPADLRASLYKAAALIPGVTLTEEQAALDGRKGIAIGRTEEASHTRQDIIIDPKSGLLIGERQVLTQASETMPAGTAITWTSIQTSVSNTAP